MTTTTSASTVRITRDGTVWDRETGTDLGTVQRVRRPNMSAAGGPDLTRWEARRPDQRTALDSHYRLFQTRRDAVAWLTRTGQPVTGADVATARRQLAMTVGQLADALNVHPRTVRSWEAERDRPGPWLRQALTDLLSDVDQRARMAILDPVFPIRRGSHDDMATAMRARQLDATITLEWAAAADGHTDAPKVAHTPTRG